MVYIFKWEKDGYTSIGIFPNLFSYDVEDLDNTPKYLFNKHDFKFVEIKNCENNESGIFYEVTIPNEKTFWMHSYSSAGTGGWTILIDCYFDKKDLNTDCIYND